MKKFIILATIACLGLGAGIYTAKMTQDGSLSQLFTKNDAMQTGPWKVKHPHWAGNLIKNGENRVRLDANGDWATIISNKDGLITVKWDRWGTETFKCNDQNDCTLKK